MTQCVHVPFGASGSSMMRASETAWEGTFEMFNSGEMLLPWQVKSAGIKALFSKFGLERFIFV